MTSDERPEATLPLPNALAYGIAVFAVVITLMVPFAITAGGLSPAEAVGGYYVHTGFLFGVLGALILRRRPGHVLGWLLVAEGGLDALTHIPDMYELFQLSDVIGLPSRTVEAAFGWVWVPVVAVLTIALPQVFPDGRLLPGRRRRLLTWFGGAATALLIVTFMIDLDGYEPLLPLAFPLFGLASLLSLIPLVVRYRKSRGVERQQLKWVFFGLAICIPMLVVGASGVYFGAVGAAWAIPPLLIIPATITVAVLRYRLFDIDVVISRTLLVAGLAGFVTVAYVLIVVGVGSLVGSGDEPNLALSVAATAVVAVAFQPVRVRAVIRASTTARSTTEPPRCTCVIASTRSSTSPTRSLSR